MAFIADTFHLDQPVKSPMSHAAAQLSFSGTGSSGYRLSLDQRKRAADAAGELAGAFPWHYSREGAAFWTAICERLQGIAAGDKL